MIQTIARDAIIESLLNSLEAERYVRGPLLLNLIDELSAHPAHESARDLAGELLADIHDGSVDHTAFARRVASIRVAVGEASPVAEVAQKETAAPRAVAPSRYTHRASSAA